MNLANNIKILRTNNLKSQENIAEIMNVSRQTISKWENGTSEPAVNDLIRIVDIFRVTLDDLIFGNIVPMKYELNTIQLQSRGKQWKIKTESDETVDKEELIFFPEVTPEDLSSYHNFKAAYDMNMKIDKTGDRSDIGEMMDLYQEAFDDGLVEAGVNILKVVVNALMNSKAFSPDRPLPFQDRLECYMKPLENIGNPAGGFYRAFVLIYGLRITKKTEDENWDDGLILMYKLANEGNKLAMKYVEYIESAGQEN